MNHRIKDDLRNFLPRGVKRHRILAGPLRGRTMVTSKRHNLASLAGRTDPNVIAWFERMAQPGETWLDIGANYGCTAMYLADRVGVNGRVFAFEPKLDTCGCLSETVNVNGLSQVSAVPVALGVCQTIQMKRFHTSGSMAVGAAESAEGPTETLMVSRLDWLWPRIADGAHEIHGVKLDVQGMELDVLQGMTGLLKTHTPKLIVQIHAGVDRSALLGLLEECGYEPQGHPVFSGANVNATENRDNTGYAIAPRARVAARGITNSVLTSVG